MEVFLDAGIRSLNGIRKERIARLVWDDQGKLISMARVDTCDGFTVPITFTTYLHVTRKNRQHFTVSTTDSERRERHRLSNIRYRERKKRGEWIRGPKVNQ